MDLSVNGGNYYICLQVRSKDWKIREMGGRSGRLACGILWRKWRSPSHSTYENEVFGMVCAFEKKFFCFARKIFTFFRGDLPVNKETYYICL